MIGEFIYNYIKDNIPEIQDGSVYRIYPGIVPNGVPLERVITYQLLNTETIYTMLGLTYQINCFAKTYADAEAMALKISRLFQSKYITESGQMLNMSSQGIIQLPYDRDSEVYHFAVTIYMKTVTT